MTTINPALPNAQSPFTDGAGVPTRPAYQWMLSITRAVTSLQTDDVPVTPPAGDYLPISTNVTGSNSIATYGSLAQGLVMVTLQGDVALAAPTQYYGSDTAGNKGWFNVFDAFADSANIIKSVDAGGLTSFDLTDVVVTTGGMLKKYGFDPKGRLMQEGDPTTDDLPEGATNLYFTDERARAAVKCCEILVADGVSAPPVMLTNEAEDDFLYSD